MSDLSSRIKALTPEQRQRLAQKWHEARARAQPIPVRPRSGTPLPASSAQRRMWFLERLVAGSPLYNVFGTALLRGPLDVDVWRRSLNELVRRHEVLRTVFVEIDGQPWQQILPSLEIDVPVVDAEGLFEPEIEKLTRLEARRPFDLRTGPLLRARLLRRGLREHLLLFSMHHIVSDLASMRIAFGELAASYGAYAHGRAPALPPLPIQYADATAWHDAQLSGAVLDGLIDHWRRILAELPDALELPADRPRPTRPTYDGASCERPLPAQLGPRLRELALERGATLFMVLLATYAAALYRYTGQTDLLIGTPISNRPHPDIAQLIGYFANTIVVRINLTGNPSFTTLVDRVRAACLDAYAHQELPFDRLVEAIQPGRGHAPLFQAAFTLQTGHIDAVAIGALTMLPQERDTGTAKTDLTLVVIERGDGLDLRCEYSLDRFDRDRIDQFVEHYQLLLEKCSAEPQQRIGDLALLTVPQQADRKSVV